MMQPIVLKLKLFAQQSDAKRSMKSLLWLLEALCRVNQEHLKEFPYPPLYKAGVHYEREPGTEEWLDIPSLLDAGWGDCEDLACWRVAELRHRGVPAAPFVRFRKIDGLYHFHAMVERFGKGGGRWLEDPSRRLGMGSPQELAQTSRRRAA